MRRRGWVGRPTGGISARLATLALAALLASALGSAGCAKGSGGDAVCGDGLRAGQEQCDGFDLGGADCATLGMGTGQLKCTAACTYDFVGCSSPYYCGNGLREGAEACDGLDLGLQSCESLNLGTGALGCLPTCQLDTSGCSLVQQCGNGVVEGSEDCDGPNLDGRTCASLGEGFSGGQLRCTAGCQFDTSLCTTSGPVCGNGVVEPPERCDGNQFQGGATCVSLGYPGGQLQCSGTCQLDTSGCTQQAEICNNGVDDDGDSFIDCNDGDCFSDPACGGSPEVCGNGLDDDQNGYVDCDDAACASDPACQGTGAEICDNGIDDDGLFGCDCADFFSCLLDLACLFAPASETSCTNGVDDDLDCLVDCDDPDCDSDPACTGPQEICDNGVDDDGDGAVDCDDADCAGSGSCPVCSPAPAIACGQQVSGTTVGGPRAFSSEYSCGSYSETGPEAYYTFAPTASGTVTVDLVGQGSADLELMVVRGSGGDCDPTQCVDASQQSGGTEQIQFSATAGTTYFVIVEGYSNASGAYDLSVSCP